VSSFAAAFRDLVTPRLAALCLTHGDAVALGASTWPEAFADVIAEARAKGALHLPDDVYLQLEEWVAATLLAAIDKAETENEAYAAMPNAALWAIILERPWSTSP
jgi:hypothetical protein